MDGILITLAGHGLMLYACACLGAAWAWGGRRGSSELAGTVFGLAVPVGAWTVSMVKPAALWAAPASLALFYLYAARREAEASARRAAERAAERAAAEDRAIGAPDDGSARMTLARAAEEEGRWDDALDHYEAAHRCSERMFTADDLAAARDRLDAARAVAALPRGLRARPWDLLVLAACAGLALASPVRGLAPAAALLFALWQQGRVGDD